MRFLLHCSWYPVKRRRARLSPLGFGGSVACPKHPGERTFRSETVRFGSDAAYIDRTADRVGGECRSNVILHVSRQEKSVAVDLPDDGRIILVDDTTVEAQGFTENGSAVIRVRPSVMSRPRHPDCISAPRLYALNTVSGSAMALADTTVVKRNGSIARM